MPVATRQQRLTQLLQWTVTLLVAAAIVVVLYSRRDELAALVELTPGLLVAVSIAALAQFAAQGLVLKFMFEHFRARLSLAEAIIVGLMDATLNYLPMKAGTVATGAVAVKRYAIRVTEYAAGVAGATVVNVWVCGVLSGLLLVPMRPGLGLALMLAPTLVVLSLLLWGRSHADSPAEGSRFRQAVVRAARGLQSIYADHGLLTRLVLANVVRLVAVSAQLYFSFRAVSTPISVSDAIIIGGFATVLGRLSIIPGGLGFREGGVVAAAALVGIDPTVALAASVIDRAVIMLWLAVLGLPSTMYVSRTTAWHRAASELRAGRDPQPDASAMPETTSSPGPAGNLYDKYGTPNPVARRLMERFRTDLDEIRRIADPESQLDVGCGEGVLTSEWAGMSPDARLVGVDLDDTRLQEQWAQIDQPNLSFACASATDLPYTDGEFDMVSAIEVLEHVSEPEHALAEMVRVARRFVLISVPREPMWRTLNVARGSHVMAMGNTPGHLHHWSRREIVQLLASTGTVREVRSPMPWTIVLVDVQDGAESAR